MISVCIPTYEMAGKGAKFLAAALDSLKAQSFTDFEVVISDQSDTQEVADIGASYTGALTVRRLDYRDGPRQASANTNNAMRHASGNVLKILFQDDLLMPDALAKTATAFHDKSYDWCLLGSAVTRDGIDSKRPMVPRLNPKLHFGKNTISSPSVLALRAGVDIYFDEELIWLMDVDMYKRCANKLGEPAILPDTLVLNRLHENQVSAGISPELRRRELRYVRQKYRSTETWVGRLAYYKQLLKAR